MYRLLMVSFVAFLTFSCSPKNGKVLSLRKCVKSKTDFRFDEFYGKDKIDIYQMANKIEKKIISDGLIHDASKDEYLALIKMIKEKNKYFTENKLIDKYSIISSIIVVDVVSTCNYEIMIEEKNTLNSSIVNQFKISQQLLASGYDFENIKEFINNTSSEDFKNIEYRTPVIVMLLFHIENAKYDKVKRDRI